MTSNKDEIEKNLFIIYKSIFFDEFKLNLGNNTNIVFNTLFQ